MLVFDEYMMLVLRTILGSFFSEHKELAEPWYSFLPSFPSRTCSLFFIFV